MSSETNKSARSSLVNAVRVISKWKKDTHIKMEQGRMKHDFGYNEAINDVIKHLMRRAKKFL